MNRLGCIEDRLPVRDHPFFSPIDWIKLESREAEPPFKPKVVSWMLHVIMDKVCVLWIKCGCGCCFLSDCGCSSVFY